MFEVINVKEAVKKHASSYKQRKTMLKLWDENSIIKEDEKEYSIISENNHEIRLVNMNSRIDHDRLYKELFQTFFADFVQLFFRKCTKLSISVM